MQQIYLVRYKPLILKIAIGPRKSENNAIKNIDDTGNDKIKLSNDSFVYHTHLEIALQVKIMSDDHLLDIQAFCYGLWRTSPKKLPNHSKRYHVD